ncbi:hypothetical protein KZA96_23495, partial [Escherichia coli]|uniref:hypothetical protein n=1 Tax=Escherichia coli TaxID=562 RepID=UPI001C6F2074
WKGWAILLRQKQKKLIMLPSETMIWQPEFTDKTLSRKPGAVQPLNDIIVPIPQAYTSGLFWRNDESSRFCYFYAYWHCRHLCRVTSWLLVHR